MIYNEAIKKWNEINNYSEFQLGDLDEGEKYCSVYTTSNKISNELSFDFNHYQKDNHCFLPEFLSHILRLISGFKTISEHSMYIAECRYADYDLAMFCIKELWDNGLIMSQTYYNKELSSRKNENTNSDISTIGWITRNRTSSLKKSLESFIQGTKRNKTSVNFMVFDDSSDNKYKINKLNIEKISKKHNTTIRHIGKGERNVLLGKLNTVLKGKIPNQVVKYALFGTENIKVKCGANRNTFLLYTTGQLVVTTDDNIFCSITKNGNDTKLIVSSINSEFPSKYFSDLAELNRYVHYDRRDPLALHQKLLGRPISDLIQQYNGQVDLSTINSKFLQENLTENKKVRVSMMGVAGDSGAGSPISKIFLKSDNLIDLISEQKSFSSKMFSRIVLQNSKTLVVEPPNFLMGMNLGIDNTQLLPPFCPNFRNEDGIFAAVLKKCFRNSYIGHLPYAISHVPPNSRLVDSSDLTSTLIRIPDILKFSINAFQNTSSTDEGGLKALGIYLCDISAKSNNDFNQYFELVNANYQTSIISHLQQLLNNYKHINKKWVEFVELRINTLNKLLQSGDLSIKFKELIKLPRHKQLLIVRETYKNFGELLIYWPEIYYCVRSQNFKL